LVIETEVLNAREVEDPVVGSGWGGDGWGDDDSGDGWGWSEGPDGDEDEDARPYRRSRIVRAMAMVTAVAVVTGSIGTWVAILAVGSPQPTYSVTAVRATVPTQEQRGATTHPAAIVSFVVANNSAVLGRASCRAIVSTAHGIVGSSSIRTGQIPGGQSTSLSVSVPLSSLELAGNGPAGPQVSCLPSAPAPRAG
jgi:hypothetical protein